MSEAKTALKKIWSHLWELIKTSIPVTLMYLLVGSVLIMITMQSGTDVNGEALPLKWDNTKLIWTIVLGIACILYNGVILWGCGGSHYEVLVAGNVKRMSAEKYGINYKISKHKVEQEYRPWKGFVMGVLVGLFPLVLGFIFGCNQSFLHSGTPSIASGILLMVGFLLSGWCLIPFYFMNLSGVYASYFFCCLFAILPIITSGICYIWGAYARRDKRLREEAIKENQEKEKQKKSQKVNYGALPGTKPKKHK